MVSYDLIEPGQKYEKLIELIKSEYAWAKIGYYGVWEKTPLETVTQDIELNCEYHQNITILSSEEKNKVGKLALGLAEGEFDEKAPYFEEAKLVLVCRKTAKGKFEPEQFIDKTIDERWYPQKDYHNIYYGAIEKVLVKE